MVQRLPLTQARNTLGAVIKRVHLNKEYVILEKDGIPLAGVMDIGEFEDYLELQDPKVRADIAQSRKEFLAGKVRPIEKLLNEFRREAVTGPRHVRRGVGIQRPCCRASRRPAST